MTVASIVIAAIGFVLVCDASLLALAASSCVMSRVIGRREKFGIIKQKNTAKTESTKTSAAD
jgi:hypothetical protein